MIYRQTWIY